MSGGEEHLVLACSSNLLAAENPGVGRGGSRGVLNALRATGADVSRVAVVRLGGTGFELNAGQAACLVVTG